MPWLMKSDKSDKFPNFLLRAETCIWDCDSEIFIFQGSKGSKKDSKEEAAAKALSVKSVCDAK